MQYSVFLIIYNNEVMMTNFSVNLYVCLLELYEYCLKESIADKNLIAKWKKQGYENLCCLRCIQARDTNFGTNCICRVPKSKLEAVSDLCVFLCKFYIELASSLAQGKVVECVHCGCRGCSG